MASYLIHGLWLPVSGLSLWIEQVEGHKIITPQSVPEGTFPATIEKMLEKKSFRTRSRVYLRTPKGKNVELMAPMARFGPADAVQALAQLAYLDDEEQSSAIPAEQRAAVAPDLMWIIRAYRGLTRFVKAGRVTIRLSYQSGEWFPMWQLASGLGERGWLAEMVAAAPGILTINNRSLSEDLADDLTHWIAYTHLSDLMEQPRPYPWHDFAKALLQTTPITRGRAQLLRGLNEWKDSITAVDLGLVFIVEEPFETEMEVDDSPQAAPSSDSALWPVRVCVRSGADSPRPIIESRLDRSSLEKLKESRRRAIGISPRVDPRHTKTPAYFDEGAGDWDIYLDTSALVEFVSEDAAALKAAGYTVMLPKAWTHMAARAKLVTKDIAADSPLQKKLGMDQLVQYDWKLSVGDKELTDEEMEQLVTSKSGLIRLRGEWVMADRSALGKITEYMDQLAANSKTRMRKELDALAREAERMRILEEPGWEEKLAEVERRLEEFKEQVDEGDEDFGVATLSELRELALEAMAQEPIEFTGSSWHASMLGGMETPAPTRVDLPATVHAELRDYQRRGVDWLYWMSRNNVGAVLADDMGLGKTLQLLTLLAIEKDRGESTGPTIVIAPTSVVGNWAREAHKFVPDLKVMVHHGSNRAREEELIKQASDHDLVVTSYGTISRDFKVLGHVAWDRVVLDEAQAIKNSSTRSSKAVRSLPSRHRIALTGTPVENRLSEMRSILDFVNPGVLGSASFFRNHFASAIEKYQDEDMTERLRKLTAPFILRRLKTDSSIIDDLPEKSEEILTVTMTSEQAALYKALVDDIQTRMENTPKGMALRGLVLSSLTRIKQICNHPAHYLGDGSPVTSKGRHRSGKVEKLMEILDSAVTHDERVLIFTQYKAFGDILQPYLSAQLGAKIPFLHGGVPKNRRDAMVNDFQAADGAPAMILSLKAGGTGLNLTAANVVVHMDRWWNPAVENQATDRAFRIGQSKNVQVYKMITAGTLEESIQDILDGKTQLAGAVVGEGEGWITELNPEQLAQLMSYRERES
ncbi:DEAD/DEAH box helicase [Corynebacterium sp. L4756]|uniref:DEAD/DEAH box helicase n=1 Tax=unclassified Corynebacterium TaxID=2624378 RepID=UPI00374CA945